MTSMENDKMLSSEVAHYLGVSRQSLSKYIERGELVPEFVAGRYLIFTASEVQRFSKWRKERAKEPIKRPSRAKVSNDSADNEVND